MAEPDRLASRLRELQAATVARTSAPGMPALLRRVRRRRALRAGALTAMLVAVAVPVLLAAGLRSTPTPATTATATPSSAPTSTPSVLPSPTLSAAPPPVVPGAGGTGSPKPTISTGGPRVCNPSVTAVGSSISVNNDEHWRSAICAGAKVHFFWVTYRTATDGTRVKYRSGAYTLDHANPSATFSAAAPPEYCNFSVHIVLGSISIPATLPQSVTASSAGTFWAARGGRLLSLQGNHAPCPTPTQS